MFIVRQLETVPTVVARADKRLSAAAGSRTLRHRDALGFPSWSRSDVELRTWALGAALPLAGVLSGALQAEADVESFAFDVEGGGAISTALPTLRGTDWRAGLAWSAPVAGAPALSVAYKRLTGDGPEGTRVEAAGSVAFAGLLDPRLTVSGRAEASFGLGDYEQDAWRLGGAVDFASGRGGRGVSLDLDTRLVSLDDGRTAGAGMEAEVGYGLWGGRFLGLVRPYLGLTGYPGEASIRRAVGLYLRDTPATHVSVEVYEHSDDASTGLGLRAPPVLKGDHLRRCGHPAVRRCFGDSGTARAGCEAANISRWREVKPLSGGRGASAGTLPTPGQR